jgi:hypothetical protein
MIALALLIVLGAQAVIRGVIDDRIRSSATQTLQEQAQRIADDVDAVPDAAKSNRASDAARYLPGTRIEVFWPEPGSLLYYNLVRSEGLNISASARSGDVQVKLRGGTRIGDIRGGTGRCRRAGLGARKRRGPAPASTGGGTRRIRPGRRVG